MILGLDIGNITSIGVGDKEDFVTESRLREFEELDDFSGNDIVEINDKKFIFNEGYFENNVVKHEKENFNRFDCGRCTGCVAGAGRLWRKQRQRKRRQRQRGKRQCSNRGFHISTASFRSNVGSVHGRKSGCDC